jgi:hypothetical protein
MWVAAFVTANRGGFVASKPTAATEDNMDPRRYREGDYEREHRRRERESQWGQERGGYERFGRESGGGGDWDRQRSEDDDFEEREGGRQRGQSQGDLRSSLHFGEQGRWSGERGPRGQGTSGERFAERGGYGERGRYGERGQYGERGGYGQSGQQYGQSGRQGWGSEESDFGGSRGRAGSPQGFFYSESWVIEGPHTGRGPRGYRRSDDRVKEEVCDRLERHGQIDAGEIDVEVREGIVTLRGKVDDRRTKRLAEEAVENVHGVKDVMNELKVDQGFFQRLFGEDEKKGQSERDEQSRSQRERSNPTTQR